MTSHTNDSFEPWPHRLAMLLACATFPLIWVGGLVTSYDAGMAVPDWPSTYGYNLFLYPWQTWIAGPWDMFVEHGHRQFGAVVGILTILLTVTVYFCDRRTWVRWFAVATLVAVVLQGALGGARVLLGDVQLAKLHGCTAPLFFGMCIALTVFTSRMWMTPPQRGLRVIGANLVALIWGTLLCAYFQLVLGAQLRHMPVDSSPGSFQAIVLMHLLMATVLTVLVALVVYQTLAQHADIPVLTRPALALGALTAGQLLLGAFTWVVKYSWPDWLSGLPGTTGYTVEALGLTQALTVTAHVAMGSLILGCGLVLGLRSTRLMRVAPASGLAGLVLTEVMA